MLQFLASELILEIIRYFLPGLQLSVTKPHLFPWYLGQICSVWRTMFISSPQFWSNIKIDMDAHLRDSFGPFEDKNDHITELVKLALKRSNRHPLFLSLTMRQVFVRPDAASLSIDILKMLVSHSMRWKHLCIDLSPSCYSTLSGTKGHLPILRSLKVMNAPYPFPYIFMDVTQLTHISFACITDLPVNWSHITQLHLIDRFTLDEAMVIIRQTTSSLEKLVIVVPDCNLMPTGWSNSTTTVVHLPSLKELYITSLIPLQVLRTPQLEVLQIRVHRSGMVDPFPSNHNRDTILSDYFHSVHNLQKLEIFAPNKEDVIPIFEAAPNNTRELKLHHYFVCRQLPLLARCPNLDNLEAISVVTKEVNLPQMLGMIRAWVYHLEHLNQVSLQVYDHLDECNIQQLKLLKKSFKKRGIKFESIITPELLIRAPDPSFELE